MEYHHTDQLGQAVTGARHGVAEALGQLVALDEELASERESHRAEVMRLVERAEAAELERDQLDEKLSSALARTDELEAELEDATSARDDALQAATDREVDAEEARERVAELEHRMACALSVLDAGTVLYGSTLNVAQLRSELTR